MYAATSYELVLFTTQVSWSPTSSIAKAQQPSIRWCPIHHLSMATPATIPPQFWSLVPSSLCNLVPNHSWKHPTDCSTSWLWCFWEGGSKKQHSQRFNNLSHLVRILSQHFEHSSIQPKNWKKKQTSTLWLPNTRLQKQFYFSSGDRSPGCIGFHAKAHHSA